MAETKTDFKSLFSQLNSFLEEYLVKKAPQLPTKAKDILVAFAPWLTLIGLISSIPIVFMAFGLGAILAPLSVFTGPVNTISYGVTYTLGMVILAVALVFDAIALPGLFNKTKKGWTFLYYATLVSFLSNLLSYNWFGGLISAVIVLYFMFQIRSYYK
jgi:hypothetical protein